MGDALSSKKQDECKQQRAIAAWERNLLLEGAVSYIVAQVRIVATLEAVRNPYRVGESLSLITQRSRWRGNVGLEDVTASRLEKARS